MVRRAMVYYYAMMRAMSENRQATHRSTGRVLYESFESDRGMF